MEEILFTKMHGAGNDYIYINCLDSVPENVEELAIAMSDRHTGVGSDGLILIMPSEVADFRMRMYNADGSEGMMCGNASRCIAKYVHDYGLTDKSVIALETRAGVKTLTLHTDESGDVRSVTVDMGKPDFSSRAVPVATDADTLIDSPVSTSTGDYRITAVSMGNPHGVIFLDSAPTDEHVLVAGRELERHPMWPERANIEWAHVLGRHLIEMRVWERGSGETMACGTGACAVAVAAATLGLTDRDVTVRLRGGDLKITWNASDGHVLMSGPAATVMEGRYFTNRTK